MISAFRPPPLFFFVLALGLASAAIVEDEGAIKPLTRQDDGCPQGEGWQKPFGVNRCFLLYTTSVTWLEANDACEDAGGHLMRLESLEVSSMMKCFISDHFIRLYPGTTSHRVLHRTRRVQSHLVDWLDRHWSRGHLVLTS